MCLILFAIDRHPDYQLVLAANRDEFYRRPSLPAARWPDAPEVFGGRDLEKNGSWLAVSSGGRFACVTNFRESPPVEEPERSRGRLVSDFVQGNEDSEVCLVRVAAEGHLYQGFSLLVGAAGEIGYISNRGPRGLLGPGLYGIANALLDTPWPKVVHGKRALARILEEPGIDPEELFALLADRSCPGKESPESGLPGSASESLAPIFVHTPTFGTRCSTLLLISRTGRMTFIERTFNERGEESRSRVRYDFP
jgi:uncharacterized protein with NRDE domain